MIGAGTAPADALPPALRHRFDAIERLGAGGSGVVWAVEERATGARGALKLVPVPDARASARVARELDGARAVSHPGLVPLLDTGIADGCAWLLMPLLGGGSLEARLRRAGPLPPAGVIELLRRLAPALAALHAQGLVHRDVKPGNVLFGDGETARLSDFGISTRLEGPRLTSTGRVVGTPAYLSPEQLLGERATAAADQYALGATAYCALSGRPPFVSADIAAVVRGHLLEPPVPIDTLVPRCPPRLATVVHRLLRKRPADRFTSVADVVPELADDETGSRARRRWWWIGG
jgi:serine/threonine-protein kinase